MFNSLMNLTRRLTAGVLALTLALPNAALAMPLTPAEASSAPLPITLILDAHASLEAQKAIVRKLETLHAKGHLQGLLIEGAAGELDTQKLLVFKNTENNQTYGNDLMARGLIGGGLRFLMDHPDLKAYGLEDAKLYAENRRAYQRVLRAKAEMEPLLKAVQENLELQAERSFSTQAKALLKLNQMISDRKAGDFEELHEVMRTAMTWTDLDWNDWRQQESWPHLMRLWRLWEEKTIALTSEQQARLEKLDGKTNREKLENLYAAVSSQSEVKRPSESSAAENEETLALKKQLALQTLREEIKAPELFQEVERLETRLLDQSRLPEEQKSLLLQLQQIALIRKSLSLELSRQEAAALSGLLMSFPSAAIQNQLTQSQFKSLLRGLSEVDAFYEWARFRETTLSEQIIKRAQTHGRQGTWGVVIGGFHEQGLVEQLQQNGFQAEVVMPEFDGQNDPLLYQRLMNPAEKNTLALPQIAAMRSERQAEAMVGTRGLGKWQAALAYAQAGVRGEKKVERTSSPKALALSEVRAQKPAGLPRRAFLLSSIAALTGVGNLLAQEPVLGLPELFPTRRQPDPLPNTPVAASEPVLLIRPGDMEERLSLQDEKTRLALTEVTQRMYEAAMLSGSQYEAVIDYRNTDNSGRPMLRLTISPRGSYERALIGSAIGWNPGQLFEKIFDDVMLKASGRQGIQRRMAEGLIRVEYLHFRKKLDERIEAGRKALVQLQAAYEDREVTAAAHVRAQDLVARIRTKEGTLADELDVDNVERTAQILKRQVNKRDGAINTASADVLAVVSLRQAETGLKVKPEALDLDYWPPEWRWLKIEGLPHEELKAKLAEWKIWARKDSFTRLFSEDPQTRQFTGAHHLYQAALEARYVSYLSARDIEARRVAKSDFGILPGLVNALFGRTGPYAPRNAEVNSALTNVQRMDVIKDGIQKEADTMLSRLFAEIETELLALSLLNKDIDERDQLIAKYEQALNDKDTTRLQALVRANPEEDLAVQLDRLTEDKRERIQSRARIAQLIFELKSMRALAIDPQYSRPRGEKASAVPGQQPGRSPFEGQPQGSPELQPSPAQPVVPQGQPLPRQGPTYPQAGGVPRQAPAGGLPRPAADGGPAWQPDGRGGWYRNLPSPGANRIQGGPIYRGPTTPNYGPTYPQSRSEVRRQTLTPADILAVDTAAAAVYGLLLPERASELLPLLKQRQALAPALLRRAAMDVPAGVPQNIQPLFPLAGSVEADALANAPVMFVRAALFKNAPLAYFTRMVLDGLPLVVVFEPNEAVRYQAVERALRKIEGRKNPGRTFFVLAKDGSAGLVARVLSKELPDTAPRYQVAAARSAAFSSLMQTLREAPADEKSKREAAFIGIESQEARRIAAAQIPYRFYYPGNSASAAEWEYRYRMLGFILHNASYWKNWAGENPADLRLVLGQLMERLSAQSAEAALRESSA